MLGSEKTLKIKVSSAWTVSDILLSFAWKRDCPISSKLQTHEVDQGHSKKLL